ncbi:MULTISPECIES: hypothetical protein [Streptomyces]|uniref:Uncharacterized protein n=1 Tax=Streptomyces alboflavus TaxID=67267 RepID=A0A1Z1WFN8_9ACTN|nr:hypothetical protein [Streptomyces alboflavus]ARX85275.1 hypothetical protein SMD44_04734 [Streptomyces alboflavus]
MATALPTATTLPLVTMAVRMHNRAFLLIDTPANRTGGTPAARQPAPLSSAGAR